MPAPQRECGNCIYSRDIANPNAIACHRYPPQITEAQDNRVTAHFPLLAVNNWCGEHKRKTNGHK